MVKLDPLIISTRQMEAADKTITQGSLVARSRLRYQPKSLSEILLTTVLSILVGGSMMLMTTLNSHFKKAATQAQTNNLKQCPQLPEENLAVAHGCDFTNNHP